MTTEITQQTPLQAERRKLQNDLYKVALETPGKWFCIEVGGYRRQDRLRMRNAVRSTATYNGHEIHTTMSGDQLYIMIQPIGTPVVV
jgi:hypothetical protein